jgi:hypothetical protein
VASPDRSGGVDVDKFGRFAALLGRPVDLDLFSARPGSRLQEDLGSRNRHVAGHEHGHHQDLTCWPGAVICDGTTICASLERKDGSDEPRAT